MYTLICQHTHSYLSTFKHNSMLHTHTHTHTHTLVLLHLDPLNFTAAHYTHTNHNSLTYTTTPRTQSQAFPLMIGSRTTKFFNPWKKGTEKLKGIICFFCGILLVLFGWPMVGILVEAYVLLHITHTTHTHTHTRKQVRYIQTVRILLPDHDQHTYKDSSRQYIRNREFVVEKNGWYRGERCVKCCFVCCCLSSDDIHL